MNNKALAVLILASAVRDGLPDEDYHTLINHFKQGQKLTQSFDDRAMYMRAVQILEEEGSTCTNSFLQICANKLAALYERVD